MLGVCQREIRMIMVDSTDTVGACMDMFRDVTCMLNVIVFIVSVLQQEWNY